MNRAALRALLYGALWALVLTASDLALLPVVGQAAHHVALLSAVLWLMWLPAGVATAAAAGWLERRVASLPALVAAITALLLAVSQAAWWLTNAAVQPYAAWWGAHPTLQLLGMHGESFVALSHQLWASFFYGLPFAAALAFVLRAERHRAALADAELARSRAQEASSRARLDALRGRIDPALLLRALEESERRYREHPAAAERLLDGLVAFLRAAMPALRERRASVQGELRLLEAYAHLLAQLDPHAPQVEVRGALPERAAAFPPLLLTALLDRLNAASPRPSALRLTVGAAAQRLSLSLWVDRWQDAGFGAALGERARLALQSLLGADASFAWAPATAAGQPAMHFEFARVDLPPSSHRPKGDAR
jgi:hypothetical protein